MKKILLIFLGLLPIMIFSPINTLGCSCPGDPDITVKQRTNAYLESGKAVFTGEVLEINENSQTHRSSVKIRVKEYWNQVLSEEIFMDNDSIYSCSFGFQVGESYLIFAHNSKMTY